MTNAELAELIDMEGLSPLLFRIAQVCQEKSDDLAVYSDGYSKASAYSHVSRLILNLAERNRDL